MAEVPAGRRSSPTAPAQLLARRAAARLAVDGLEVLVCQGALSFELWTSARRRFRRCARPPVKHTDSNFCPVRVAARECLCSRGRWRTMDIDFADLLIEVVSRRASDLHLRLRRTSDRASARRLTPLENYPKLSSTDTREIVYSILTGDQRQRLETDWQLDFAYFDPRPRTLSCQRLLPTRCDRRSLPPDPREPQLDRRLGLPTRSTSSRASRAASCS